MWGFTGVKRKHEVDEHGALDCREVAVPEEINGDISLQQWATVVHEHNRWLCGTRESMRAVPVAAAAAAADMAGLGRKDSSKRSETGMAKC
jgi:hypothetical protein